MKNTTRILLALVEKDKEMNRLEIKNETELSEGVLSGTIFFLLKKKTILVEHTPIKTPPWKKATYRLNPKKAKFIIKQLEEEGIDLV